MTPEKTHDSLREEMLNRFDEMFDKDDMEFFSNLLTQIHDSAYSAGIQKGLAMAVGCIANRTEYDFDWQHGYDSCRQETLDALKRLRGEGKV